MKILSIISTCDTDIDHEKLDKYKIYKEDGFTFIYFNFDDLSWHEMELINISKSEGRFYNLKTFITELSMSDIKKDYEDLYYFISDKIEKWQDEYYSEEVSLPNLYSDSMQMIVEHGDCPFKTVDWLIYTLAQWYANKKKFEITNMLIAVNKDTNRK